MTAFSNMTNEKLDSLIVKVMGRFTTRDGDKVAVCMDDDNAELMLIHDDWRVTWSPSTEAGDFDDVEYWIEQQGWSWRSNYEPATKQYYYAVQMTAANDTSKMAWAIEKTTRVQTGCIALLRLLKRLSDDKDLW